MSYASYAFKVNDGTADSAEYTMTINVTNADDPGVVSLSAATPVVGSALIATLSDPDGSVTGKSWTWSRGNTRTGTFTLISGANAASYTPVSGDAEKYLKATVGYTDGQGSGKSASGTSDNPTVTNPPPVFANASETFTVNENATSGTVGTVTADRSGGRDGHLLCGRHGRNGVQRGLQPECRHRSDYGQVRGDHRLREQVLLLGHHHGNRTRRAALPR